MQAELRHPNSFGSQSTDAQCSDVLPTSPMFCSSAGEQRFLQQPRQSCWGWQEEVDAPVRHTHTYTLQ